MNPASWGLVLILIVLALMVLPLMPALLEWRRRSDAEPLRVVREQDTSIRHFAHSFRRLVAGILETHGLVLDALADGVEGAWMGSERFRTVGGGGELQVRPEEQRSRAVSVVIVAGADLHLPALMVFEQEVYCGGTLGTGDQVTARALYAESGISLGRDCVTGRWLHAGGWVTTRTGCRLYGRASSDAGIWLAPGARFERVSAPMILTGRIEKLPDGGDASAASPWNTPEHALALDDQTRLLKTDLMLPPGAQYAGNLVVHGQLRLGRGAKLGGSLKARDDLILDGACLIRGALVSESTVRLGPGCRVAGPIIAEQAVHLGPGCVIGSPNRPTTITAPRILVSPGAAVSGSLWAAVEGSVLADGA